MGKGDSTPGKAATRKGHATTTTKTKARRKRASEAIEPKVYAAASCDAAAGITRSLHGNRGEERLSAGGHEGAS